MSTQQTPAKSTPLQTSVMMLAVSPAVASDGTVFALTNEGLLWQSSDRGAGWTQVGLPGSGLAMSLAVSQSFDQDGLIWVSLAEGAIVWSPDRGQTWRDAYLTRPASAAGILAVSPAVASDGLALAATMDDGVMRSVDRGRTWSPANFGLLDLKTLGLAMCPNFASEQVCLVGTETALYRSRNGGLSWKEVGFWEDAVQSMVFSPGFASDRRAWVGTEHSGLLTSQDGGLTWAAVDTFPKISINALATLATPRVTVLAGTVEGLYVSADQGKTWEQILPETNILSLATAGGWAMAATEANGLYMCSGQPDHWTKV